MAEMVVTAAPTSSRYSAIYSAIYSVIIAIPLLLGRHPSSFSLVRSSGEMLFRSIQRPRQHPTYFLSICELFAPHLLSGGGSISFKWGNNP
jgi:hypothetical protein